MIKKLLFQLKKLFLDATKTTLTLLKIMVPISIVIKILKVSGIIEYIGDLLSPVMTLLGLPGEYGLAWATAMMTNVYGGIIVLFSLIDEQPMTEAQVTILCTIMLVAHALPVEGAITKKAGVRFRFMTGLRILGAFALGWILHLAYSGFNLYQSTCEPVWRPKPQKDAGWLQWGAGEIQKYLMIFVIIFLLLLIMALLEKFGIVKLMNNLLEPVLKLLGISKHAAPLTIIGITLGLSYGGGLIIKDAQAGHLSKKDILFSLSLLALSHSLIEDTLLMLALGASVSGVLIGRFVFTLIVIFCLVKLVNRVSEQTFTKIFVK